MKSPDRTINTVMGISPTPYSNLAEIASGRGSASSVGGSERAGILMWECDSLLSHQRMCPCQASKYRFTVAALFICATGQDHRSCGDARGHGCQDRRRWSPCSLWHRLTETSRLPEQGGFRGYPFVRWVIPQSRDRLAGCAQPAEPAQVPSVCPAATAVRSAD